MKRKLILLPFVFTVVFILLHQLSCTLPSDPSDPSNTTVTAALRTSDWQQHSTTITDTVGNTVQIGAAIRLQQYIDSIALSVAADGVPVFDTMFTIFSSGITDTVWKKMYFSLPGTKTVSITPFSSTVALKPIVAVVNILARPDQQNVKPVLTLPVSVTVQPAEACSILVKITDSDLDQSHTLILSHAPTGAVLQGDSLIAWPVPAVFLGIDSIVVVVTDNGVPSQSDTATTVLTTSTAGQSRPVIKVNGNLSVHPLETCSLSIAATDADPSQIVTVTMSGNPAGAQLLGITQFLWNVPAEASGSYPVTFIVQDNGNPPLRDSVTVSIQVVSAGVNRTPIWQGDTLEVNTVVGDHYSSSLATICSDPDGDAISFNLLEEPSTEGSVLDGTYNIDISNDLVGVHFVHVVATDPGNLSDTMVIKLTVSYSVSQSTSIATLTLSAGTFLQLSGSVIPDTVRDTVSFIDSTITATITALDNMVTITIDGNIVSTGTPSARLELPVGDTFFTITLTSGEFNRIYILATVRKPNSTIELTTTPSGVTVAAVSASAIHVTWDDLFGANSYTIQRSATGMENSFATIKTSTGNSILDSGLIQNSIYYYRVSASNSNNTTGYSDPASATTWTKIVISRQPHDTTLVVGSSLILSVAAAGTNLQYEWQKNSTPLTETSSSLTLASLATVDAGIYKVKVRNASDSAVSTQFRVKVLPQTPSNVTATPRSGTSIAVTWNAVAGATSYTIIRSVNSGAYTPVGASVQTNMVDTPLTEGTTYSYRLFATNSDGSSDTTAAVSATTLSSPHISTTLQPLTVAVGQAINLSISPATGSGQITYQWEMNGAPLSGQLSTTLSILSAQLSDSGLYRIAATNSAGVGRSNEVKVTVLPTYTLMVNKTATGGKVNLSKDTAAYIAGIQVTLTAVPNTGYRFDGWSGDTDIIAGVNPLTITMKKNRTISAKYVRQYTLTLATTDTNKGSVSSTLGSSPLKVDSGTVVPIAATASGVYTFKQWSLTSGQATIAGATTASTSVTMSQSNATVTAEFEKVCNGYSFSCGTCGEWDFESNTVENWTIDNDPNWPLDGGGSNNGVQSVTVTSTKVHSGSHALAAPINTYASDGEQASVTVPLCSNGTLTNLAGFTVSAWVYFAGPQFGELTNVQLVAWGPDEANLAPILWGANITPNTWIRMEITFVNATEATNIAVHLRASEEWTGTLYVDDVLITGP